VSVKNSKEKSSLIGERLEIPASLWAATAIPGATLMPLRDNVSADVAIIGAGFTGLSAAIELAELGLSSVVIEAGEPGWGASGRNNGQVIAGLKQDPNIVESVWPGKTGERLVRFGSEAPGKVFDLIHRHGIDCAAVNKGWIQPAYTRKGEAAVLRRAKAWREREIDTQIIEGSALHDLLGTRKYHIGWLDPRGGSVQPLSYARGLAHAAVTLGVRVFDRTISTGIVHTPAGFEVSTGEGMVKAKHVIVATGAYAETLVPGLRRSFVPVRTAQVATRKLCEAMRSAILPMGYVASDTRELLTSFRLSPDGRLVMGGSGATAGLSHAGVVPHLHKAGVDLFGHLGKLEWEFAWSGYFAVTTDHLPHVHEPMPNLHVAAGCNGRGIAVSTAMGIELARRINGASGAELSIPVSEIRGVTFHEFRALGVAVATRYKRLQDRFS